ncbi:hypothetical protein [Kitasatospora sp. NPDC005748]|uniref:hypothetical protein n=1 Tax=Kitasatospora sp. NPDC005748 TaxID=3157063 RepID=UPI0033F911CB
MHQGDWDEVITTVRPGGFQQSDLDHPAAVTIPTVDDPKGVVEQSPLSQGRSYEGRIGSRPVTFTAGRQGWWNHTSLNAQ